MLCDCIAAKPKDKKLVDLPSDPSLDDTTIPTIAHKENIPNSFREVEDSTTQMCYSAREPDIDLYLALFENEGDCSDTVPEHCLNVFKQIALKYCSPLSSEDKSKINLLQEVMSTSPADSNGTCLSSVM